MLAALARPLEGGLRFQGGAKFRVYRDPETANSSRLPVILRVTGEVNSTAFLWQRLSIAVQRGMLRWPGRDAASVLGTIGSTEVM